MILDASTDNESKASSQPLAVIRVLAQPEPHRRDLLIFEYPAYPKNKVAHFAFWVPLKRFLLLSMTEVPCATSSQKSLDVRHFVIW